jgi:hypothetical protein
VQLQGWGCGGRGNIPSPAQRFRSRLEFSEQETLTAIVNRDFAGFVFPHPHAALGRSPVLTLPFQLQQPMVVAHHPILTHHSFLLQPEHLIRLCVLKEFDSSGCERYLDGVALIGIAPARYAAARKSKVTHAMAYHAGTTSH